MFAYAAASLLNIRFIGASSIKGTPIYPKEVHFVDNRQDNLFEMYKEVLRLCLLRFRAICLQ